MDDTADSAGTAINSLNTSLALMGISAVLGPTSLALMFAGISAVGLRRMWR